MKSKHLIVETQTCLPRLRLALYVLFGSHHIIIILKNLISCQHLQIGRKSLDFRLLWKNHKPWKFGCPYALVVPIS